MTKKLGQQGEALAAAFLIKKGYKILEKNYYTRYGEIDVVCDNNQEIIFVEVKTRRSMQYGSPEEAVTYRKIQHIKHAALLFLNENPRPHRGIRFDVIAIRITPDGKAEINHIENAF